MKGSMKVKFDLGWVFSAMLALGIVVFAAARVSFAIDVQSRLDTSCSKFEKEFLEVLGKNAGDSNGKISQQCVAELKKPTVSIIMDTNTWSFQEVYPDAVKLLNK